MSDERTDRGFGYRDACRASSSVRLLKLFEEGEAWERDGDLSKADSELWMMRVRIRPGTDFDSFELVCLLSEVRRELVRRYRAGFKALGLSDVVDPTVDDVVGKITQAMTAD